MTNDTIHKADQDEFRDHLATVDARGKRNWVYAHKPKGRFYTARTIVSLFFFALFFTLPFIKAHGRPFVLLNFPNAEFILFGKIFWPQDFFIFGLMMVTFIVFIVLFTAAFGRLFCGWVCPQTVFMEMLFRKLEYWIEGDAAKQRLLNKGPWTAEKIRKKAIKHVVFFTLAFIIANYFLAYIISMDELKKIISEPVSEHLVGFIAIVIFSFVFYFVYIWFREQACTVVCPYGRLQSVLLDRNSMIVAYDYKRGEPREKFRKNKMAGDAVGDCIDCFQCVKVCPTGIDIRNGTQMECVNCTACIDACDHIMDSVNRPRGLIRYASENGIARGDKLHFTGRMKFYTVVLTVLAGLLTFMLVTRKEIDGTIIRVPGFLYQEMGPDSLANYYSIKIQNKTIRDIPVQLKVESAMRDFGSVKLVGSNAVIVKKASQGIGNFFIVLPKSQLRSREIRMAIGLYDGDKKITTLHTNFMGPFTKF